MSGMVTTANTSLSESGSRMMTIEVTGMCRQDVMRTSNYTVKVPYSRMSQTIQNINRMGGKVANISVGGTSTATEASSESPAAEEDNSSAKRKNRKRK